MFITLKITFIFIIWFHIFSLIYSSFHGFIWNQHNDQLCRGHGFKSCTGLIFFRPYFTTTLVGFTTVKIMFIFTFLSAVHTIFVYSHSFIYHFPSLLVTNITTSSLLALTQLVELQWYCRGHGFKSLTGLNFFQASFSLLLK